MFKRIIKTYTKVIDQEGSMNVFKTPDIETMTIDDVLTLPESQYFERKSAELKAAKLNVPLTAMANADGGVIAVGVSDGNIEGISRQGNIKVNDYIQCKMAHCHPNVKAKERYLDVVNEHGVEDRVLLIQVEPSPNTVHKTASDDVYLRIGDESVKLNHEQRLDLEFDKGERSFEDQIVENCNLADLDEELLRQYSKAVGYEGDDLIQPLYARGFIHPMTDGGIQVTAAAALLFAKYPMRFFPNSRVRFIRYEGSSEEVGTSMNIIKQSTIEGPLPTMLEHAKKFISSQLRDFTSLDPLSGKFATVPEYPEFAWLEGVVNAVTHRAYNITGDDIKIKMFDDRLEISSPGRFPHIVNRDNIKQVRYSRNSRIARALTDLRWVRELGEGVKRMYKEMEDFFLDAPEYKETESSVVLTLKNNIVMRRIRREERISTLISTEWDELNEHEKKAIEYVYSKGSINTTQLKEIINRSRTSCKNTLKGLVDKEIFALNSTSPTDPNQFYTLRNLDK
ncbi:putative DNA binding domain-containing protein [Sporosarcina sp. GW1-11]|uniref:ATP-binding protein n=1 Tax=Sporosarcina sp. GW1-11 TaxID=2899126 RepID=UPI00294F96E0|nr:ATP-binding protein [Sporosarcina sp. GW1-11]MDV6378215.1 putative DNA binding domain-containing protein [Sporosarcina sp. GW1-11]